MNPIKKRSTCSNGLRKLGNLVALTFDCNSASLLRQGMCCSSPFGYPYFWEAETLSRMAYRVARAKEVL